MKLKEKRFSPFHKSPVDAEEAKPDAIKCGHREKLASAGENFSFVIYRISENYVSNEIEHFHERFSSTVRGAKKSSRNVNL